MPETEQQLPDGGEPSAVQVLAHPELGQLTFNPVLHWWEVPVALQPGCWITLCVEPDTDLPTMLTRAVAYLHWAREAEPLCREQIANDLLALYNEVWADEDESEGPGKLSRQAFKDSLRPESLIVSRDGESTWDYSDNDLFAGHGIVLGVKPDRSFTEAYLCG